MFVAGKPFLPSLMDRLHWRHLWAKLSVTATHDSHLGQCDSTCLGHLGWRTRNRNNPICVASPKVAKASTMMTVICCCCWHYRRRYRSKLRQCKHGLMHVSKAYPSEAPFRCTPRLHLNTGKMVRSDQKRSSLLQQSMNCGKKVL